MLTMLGSACLQRRLRPLLERHVATIYVSGHDHALFHVAQVEHVAICCCGGGGDAVHVAQVRDGGAATVHYHGVGAGFTTSASARHVGTCDSGQSGGNSGGNSGKSGRRLLFHHRGRPVAVARGGFAGARVRADGVTVTHYDAGGRALYSHTAPRRARG